MPAFDVTASPAQLTLKAGEKGTVTVTVTNCLNHEVTARADMVVTPQAAEAWVTAPAATQCRFSGQKATDKFLYEVELPPGYAEGISFTLRVDVVDVDHMEDNFGQSNAVAVTVPAPAPVKPDNGKKKIPVWVWPVAAAVLIGIGVVLWLVLRQGGMPGVVGKSYAEAEKLLQQEGLAVQRVDSLSSAADTATYGRGIVMKQWPEAGTKLTGKKDAPDTARVVVQKDFTVVPDSIVNVAPVEAGSRLGMAGLAVRMLSKSTDSATAASGKIVDAQPGPQTLAVRGDTVSLYTGLFRRFHLPPIVVHDATIDAAMSANRTQLKKWSPATSHYLTQPH